MRRSSAANRAVGWMVLCGLFACDEPPQSPGLPGLGDAGSEEDAPRFAAVLSDYTASWVSLLDARGEVTQDGYLHSGSRAAELVTALSGDVGLPTESRGPGVLVLLDRFQTDAIIRVRLSDGEILGQLKTHTPPPKKSSSTYSSNPQDYVYIDEHTAWVSRHEPNLDPSVPELERGTDLLRVDPARMERTADRIDLSSLDTWGTRVNPDTGATEQVKVYARPSRMLYREGRLVVGLARLSFDFSAAGEGAVAIVDLATRSVQSLALEGLTNCPEVAPVPSADDLVVVSCSGFWQGERGETAGLVLLRLTEDGARIEHMYRAKDHPEHPLAVQSPISLGGTRVAVVAHGELSLDGSAKSTSDVFGVLDLENAHFTPVLEAEAPFVLGVGFYDQETQLLLLPDASVDKDKRPTQGIRRFRVKPDTTLEVLTTAPTNARTSMPVQAIYPL